MGTLVRSVLPLALLLLAPAAAAHGGVDEGVWLGDASAHVRLVGAPTVAAGAPMRLEVAIDDPDAALDARLVGPSGEAGAWFPLRREHDLHVQQVALDAAGAWRIDVRAGANVASIDVRAWPAARAFVEPAGALGERGVAVQGRADPLLLRLVDASHAPIEPPADAQARVSGPEGVEMRPLSSRDGGLALDRAWDTPGSYAIEVIAPRLGLVAGARPPVQILVVPPEEAAVYGLEERDVAWGLLAVPALAIAVALRLTRGRP